MTLSDSDFLFDGPADAPLVLALAHGAGASMNSPFMAEFAGHMGGAGWRVARFEFPYMAKRREDGKKRGPDRQPVLLDHWRAVIGHLGAERLVIGGKSMGGRMASLVADETGVRGLVCLGYPFHPPGKPEKLRTGHLADLKTPALILQGERDTFGTREEVEGYDLSPAIRLAYLPDGDHGFKPRKASGHTEAENIKSAARLTADFMETLL